MSHTPTKPISIVLIEDQKMVAESMAISLRASMGVVIVGIFTSVDSALQGAAQLEQAQVALVDIRMGEQDAFALVASLRQKHPNLRLIWLTSMVEDYLLQRAFEERLPGFVHKEDPISVLVEAIKTVARGGAYLSEAILELQIRLRTKKQRYDHLLSLREQEVLRHLGCGYSNQEVANILGLKALTIHSHRKNIMAKLGLHTSMDLVVYAVSHGFADSRHLKTLPPTPPTAP